MGEDGEIEITPEMIEAGVAAYYAVDMRAVDEEYLVSRIFEAMVAACRTWSCKQQNEPLAGQQDTRKDSR
jgi:hypothetical protein